MCCDGGRSFIDRIQGNVKGYGRFLNSFSKITKDRVEVRLICAAKNLLRVACHRCQVSSQNVRAHVARCLIVRHLGSMRWSCSRLKLSLGELAL